MPRAAKVATTKDYSSPLRDEAKRATRERIIDALVRVVIDDGVHAFSVASVAAAAGVSHRTVYRHFASREELLEGLAAAVDDAHPAHADGTHEVAIKSILDGARDEVGVMIHGLDRMRDRAAAEFIIGVALRHNTRGKRARWALLQAEVRERFPALRREEQLAGAATLRALLGSNTWFQLRVQLDVPAEVAVQGVSRALELVLADLAQRNAARSREKKNRGER